MSQTLNLPIILRGGDKALKYSSQDALTTKCKNYGHCALMNFTNKGV
jgi:hypothetical protein